MHPDADREAEHYRRLERAWQDRVGWQLLDLPHAEAGSAAVVRRQHDRIAACLDLATPGVIVEVGCGHGQLLERLRAAAGQRGPTVVGIDPSRAAGALPAKGLAGVRGDGERLPFRDAALRGVVYDGALHHLIDYRAALREAHRVLVPGGRLVLLEPVTSRFTGFVTLLRDRFAPGAAARESPIDRRYRAAFVESAVLDCLRGLGMDVRYERTDFLAYPITGAYAGFAASRWRGVLGALVTLEDTLARTPGVRRAAAVVAWRFLVTATKEPA